MAQDAKRESPDVEELVDAVTTTKGVFKYTDGLSEDNWEKVSDCV